MIEIKSGDICENCKEHPATQVWIGEGGSLAITRDYMQAKWCKCCVLKTQIEYADALTLKLALLKQELLTACVSI